MTFFYFSNFFKQFRLYRRFLNIFGLKFNIKLVVEIVIIKLIFKKVKMPIVRNLAFIIVVSFISISVIQAEDCHYSCEKCVLPHHQFCKSCKDGYQLKIVRNPSEFPVQFRKSRSVTGICSKEQQISVPNILGIIILISAIFFIPITKSPLLFHIVSTIQSMSLFKLIEIGWMLPVSYLLNSFQYLSPCNIMTNQIKRNSWEMKLYSYYHVESLFIEPHLQKSFSFLGILNVIVFSLIFIVHLLMNIKKNYFEQSCRQVFCFSEPAMKKYINFLNCLYFLLIQQTALSIVVSLQFLKPDTFTIAGITVSLIMLVLYCLQIAKFRIVFFSNRLIQYYSIIKKIIYPIFVIIPFSYQYFLVILMIVNSILQAIFDYKLNTYPFKSRNTLSKILQITTYIFIGIFYAADDLGNSQSPAIATNAILAIFLCINLLFFFVQIVFGIKSRVQGIDKKASLMLPEVSVLNRDQTGLATTKRQQKRQTTQQSFMQRQNTKNNFELQLNQQTLQPQKADRQRQKSDTKDSYTNKKSKSDAKSNIQIEQLEQEAQKPKMKQSGNIQYDESSQKNKQANKKREQLAKRRDKNNQKLKEQLKKRYAM